MDVSAQLTYVDGVSTLCDYLELDLINQVSMDEIANELGYQNVVKRYFKLPKQCLKTCLRLLWNDESYLELRSITATYKTVEVFFEHGLDETISISNKNSNQGYGKVNQHLENDNMWSDNLVYNSEVPNFSVEDEKFEFLDVVGSDEDDEELCDVRKKC